MKDNVILEVKNVEKYQNEYKIKNIGIKTAEDREGE